MLEMHTPFLLRRLYRCWIFPWGTKNFSNISKIASSLSEISQNWVWSEPRMCYIPCHRNNLANLYNFSRCSHLAAKMWNIGIWYHMVLSRTYNLLHTFECDKNGTHSERHFARIPMENLRILKSGGLEVIEASMTSDPPVRLKELYLTHFYPVNSLWNYLASVTSLTHLFLPYLRLLDDTPLSLSPFKNYNISMSTSL